MKEDLEDSNEDENEAKPSQTQDDVLKNVQNSGHSQVISTVGISEVVLFIYLFISRTMSVPSQLKRIPRK